MESLPLINLEHIVTKIIEFLGTLFHAVFGWGSGWGSFGAVLSTILTLCFLIFITWAIYIRVRIYEVDKDLSGTYDNHFIKPELKVGTVNMRWQKIVEQFLSSNPNDWRAAILGADIILDELVTNLGYDGDGLGEKLRKVRLQDFPTLHSAWEAHKIRNKIAHTADYHLSDREKEVARKHFENVFRSVGMI